jgi:hypothetical protein
MHRFRRAFVVAVSGAVMFGGGVAVAAAAAPTNLHVDDASKSCTDTGSGAGSIATPFCTIQAAANAAIPGDNVGIAPGTYVGAVDIKTSGTAAAPIDFLSAGTGPTVIELGAGQTGPALTLDGASYVGFYGSTTMVSVWPYYRVPDTPVSSVLVTGSSHITLEGLEAASTAASPAVELAGSSSDITLTGDALSGQHGGVLVDPGSSGDIITNDVITSQGFGVDVDGASNTAIGSNTFWGQSAADDQIAVAAGATGTSIENNIVAYPETTAGNGAAISVDSASAAGTTEDYNVVWPDQRGTSTTLDSAYAWSGTDYATQAALTTATGQGKHDAVADPQLQADSPFTESVTAPQFSSANNAAPGWQTWDYSGNYCAGIDPFVATTGAGNEPDCARGAVQQAIEIEQSNESPTAVGLDASMQTSVYGLINIKGVWTRIPPEPTPQITQTIAWGDGTSSTVTPHAVNTDTTTSHTYAKNGTYPVTVTVTTPSAGNLTGTWPFTLNAALAGTLLENTRELNGAWGSWASPTGSTGIANAAITATVLGGTTQLVAATTAGAVEYAVLDGNNNVQEAWSATPQPGVAVKSVGIAGMPNLTSQLIAVTSTGTLLHTVRNANGTWQSSWGSPAGSTGIAQAAITAMPDGSSQLVAVTTHGALEHNIRNANGTWQGWRTLTQPGVTVTDASIAGMPNGSSQIIEITSIGLLKHDIRNANGTWQPTGWGSPAGSTGIGQAAITAMPNGDSQLAAVTTSGVLEHDIRHANGSWQPTGWADPTQTDQVLHVSETGIAGMRDGSSQIIELSAN